MWASASCWFRQLSFFPFEQLGPTTPHAGEWGASKHYKIEKKEFKNLNSLKTFITSIYWLNIIFFLWGQILQCLDVFPSLWGVSNSVLVNEFPSLFMRWLCSQQISCRLSLKLHVCFWNWTFYRLSCCLSSDFLSEKPDKVATVPKVCVYHPTLNFHRLANLRKWKWKRKCMFTVDLVRIYNKS